MPRGGARPNSGGYRPGSGRPKGSRNKRSIARGARLEQILNRLIPDEKLAELLYEIAHGAERTVLLDGCPVTVRDAPDGATARYLADRKWGKMPQPIAGVTDSPVRVVFDDRLGIKH